ncbi:MAG: CAP domain-containing protein [Gemmatimonadota bacterium]|nr:MAG: CAP domain-containing protein [Gemmatimonadota bacterium]
MLPAVGFAQADSLEYLSELERGIVREHNRVRSDPAGYARFLRDLKPRFDGLLYQLTDSSVRETEEGIAAVDEAVHLLEATVPLPPVGVSRGMSLGARDLVADQGRTGRTGHLGSDGSQPWDRVDRYGDWEAAIAENVAYGYDTARDVVTQLLVDDGVPERSHRANILNPELRVVGVACGPHSGYGIVCVMTYAGGYKEQP